MKVRLDPTRRRRKSLVAPPPTDPNADDRIGAWLDVFVHLLHVPPAEREAIRNELESHLRERARDLMLRGRSETEAAQQAIDELGVTAELASRYDQNARTRYRRLLMHLSMFGLVAITGVIASIALLTQPTSSGTTPIHAFAEASLQDAPLPPLELSLMPDQSFRDFIDQVQAVNGVKLTIDYRDLIEAGIDPDDALNLHADAVSLEAALRLIEVSTAAQLAPIGWRFDGDRLTISTRERLDRQETELVSYDLRDVLRSIAAERYRSLLGDDEALDHATADVISLLQEMVAPNDWTENGGNLAKQQMVGTKLFVQAPRRMHEKIRWIIEDLAASVAHPAAMAPKSRPSGTPHAIGGGSSRSISGGGGGLHQSRAGAPPRSSRPASGVVPPSATSTP